MARRRNTDGFAALAGLPWPVGIIAGVLGFFAIRYLPAWWFSSHGGALAQGLGTSLGPLLAPLAWLVLALCWIAALVSHLGARRRRRLLDTCRTLDNLVSGSWHEFELLVGEAFRRQGYAVEETGLGGPDGGIDLILRKHGRKVLVQCKQWKRRQIGVSVVREMAGVLAHHGAEEVKIVCTGAFTRDAQAFAAGKSIHLISGEELLAMIRATQGPAARPQSPLSRTEPTLRPTRAAKLPAVECPQCGSPLVPRTNRRTGEQFQGCSQFPRCRGTAQIA